MRYLKFGPETLKGLPGVMVLAELNAPTLQGQEGMPSKEGLQAVLERVVYQAGVGVLSSAGMKGTNNNPVLFLRASILAVGAAAFVYGLNLFLMQSVALSPDRMTSAVTWEHGMVGSVVNQEWHTFRESVTNLGKRFANDFSQANPPGPGLSPMVRH